MLRDRYHTEMKNLEGQTLDLGRTVASAVGEAVEAFVQRDTARAETIVARDKRVNQERLAIQSEVLTVIATQQPVASDVRLLASILEAVAEIERIGDYAKGIGSITLKSQEEAATFPPNVLNLLVEMSGLARDMMRRSLVAFEARDAELACQIITEDDGVDLLFKQCFQAVLAHYSSDPLSLEAANYLLWVAHNLERTADRVTNICESVVYMVGGELVSGRKMALNEFMTSLRSGRIRAPEVEPPDGEGGIDPDGGDD